ncbi:hypothetical protein CPC08DRAFT_725779 [Agrocybe pediades]|nr:hypothetical protein CPC08DRAFT_725779 [Agrocybe pediades]
MYGLWGLAEIWVMGSISPRTNSVEAKSYGLLRSMGLYGDGLLQSQLYQNHASGRGVLDQTCSRRKIDLCEPDARVLRAVRSGCEHLRAPAIWMRATCEPPVVICKPPASYLRSCARWMRVVRDLRDRYTVHLSTTLRNTVTHNNLNGVKYRIIEDFIVVPTIRDCYSILKFAHYLSPFMNMLQFFVGTFFLSIRLLENCFYKHRIPDFKLRIREQGASRMRAGCEPDASLIVLACSQAARRFLFAPDKAGIIVAMIIAPIFLFKILPSPASTAPEGDVEMGVVPSPEGNPRIRLVLSSDDLETADKAGIIVAIIIAPIFLFKILPSPASTTPEGDVEMGVVPSPEGNPLQPLADRVSRNLSPNRLEGLNMGITNWFKALIYKTHPGRNERFRDGLDPEAIPLNPAVDEPAALGTSDSGRHVQLEEGNSNPQGHVHTTGKREINWIRQWDGSIIPYPLSAALYRLWHRHLISVQAGTCRQGFLEDISRALFEWLSGRYGDRKGSGASSSSSFDPDAEEEMTLVSSQEGTGSLRTFSSEYSEETVVISDDGAGHGKSGSSDKSGKKEGP